MGVATLLTKNAPAGLRERYYITLANSAQLIDPPIIRPMIHPVVEHMNGFQREFRALAPISRPWLSLTGGAAVFPLENIGRWRLHS
jgi:hypothetical protein